MNGANPVVLLIDDDAGVRDVTTFYVEDFTGKEVLAFDNVEKAIQAAGDYRVGLVITDYFMPGPKTPEQSLNMLREAYPGVKVVCHTGSQKITKEMGYDEVLYKPEGLDGIVEMVKAELN